MFDILRGLTNAVSTIVTAPVKIISRETGKDVEKAAQKILQTPVDLAEEVVDIVTFKNL